MENFDDFLQGNEFFNLMEDYRNAKTMGQRIKASFELKKRISDQVNNVFILKNKEAEELRMKMNYAASLLTSFLLSSPIFLQPDGSEDRTKERIKVGYALRDLVEKFFHNK